MSPHFEQLRNLVTLGYARNTLSTFWEMFVFSKQKNGGTERSTQEGPLCRGLHTLFGFRRHLIG